MTEGANQALLDFGRSANDNFYHLHLNNGAPKKNGDSPAKSALRMDMKPVAPDVTPSNALFGQRREI